MKKTFLVTIIIGLFLFPAFAGAVVVTFDDLPAVTGSDNPIPNGYAGFNWANMYYLNPDTYIPNSGYTAGRVSNENVAFNAFGRVALVSGSTFDFNGTYLTGAWNDGLQIGVRGLLGGVSLYYSEVTVSSNNATWFDFNYLGIDQLVFESWGGTPDPDYIGYGLGTQFVMDNFTADATAVPEPSTLILLGSGLLGVVVIRRRKTVA